MAAAGAPCSTSTEIPLDQVLVQGAPLAKVVQGWVKQLEGLGIGREHVHIRGGNVTEAIMGVFAQRREKVQ